MTLRSIAYISRVSEYDGSQRLPAGLSEILQKARRRNARHGVTGILTYKQGHYMQIIEGQDDVVMDLYLSIRKDPRHKAVTTLITSKGERRYFPDWNMRLISSAEEEPEFITYMRDHHDHVARLGDAQRKLISIFYAGNNEHKAETFHGKDLKLSAWPDFTMIETSPEIIELCARLTSKPATYKSLVDSSEFANVGALDNVLLKFQSMGVLKVSNSKSGNSVERPMSSTSKNSFYEKLRKLLTSG